MEREFGTSAECNALNCCDKRDPAPQQRRPYALRYEDALLFIGGRRKFLDVAPGGKAAVAAGNDHRANGGIPISIHDRVGNALTQRDA
jgi:hypothetical protein